jgi:hypothetical protein
MEVGGQLHDPGRFTPKEKVPGTHWIGGLVDLRAGMKQKPVEKEDIRVGGKLRTHLLQYEMKQTVILGQA